MITVIPNHASRPGAINIIWPALALSIFTLFAALYLLYPTVYAKLIDLWSFQPFRYPFLDSEFYITTKQCFQRGINVYAANPCDGLNRVFSNSPIWLRLPGVPTDTALNPAFGTIFCLAFFASLAALPRITTFRGNLIGIAALLSPFTVFAVERANLDLLVFALATLAMRLLAMRPLGRGKLARAVGYATINIGFILKFYPITLMLLALRERPRVTATLAAISATVIATYTAIFHHELHLMAANLPHPDPFADGFAAREFTDGLRRWWHWGFIRAALLPLQILASVAIAWRITRTSSFAATLARLTPAEHTSLLTGALLICGCFFAGPSIGYRAIHLLFALPGLLVIAASPPPGRLRRLWRATPAITIFLMWNLVLARLIGTLHTPIGAHATARLEQALWLSRQACWWWLITALLAVVLQFAGTSRTVKKVLLF